MLNDLFEQGVAVKILDGIAAGEHTERSLTLDLALALAEDRRRDIVRKTRNGLESAAGAGRKGGRPRVVDPWCVCPRHSPARTRRRWRRSVWPGCR
ncbi:hypothetical protein PWG71_12095 [Nocardiopsis sp. N85]|uniref:hypothetical protein n=1 Tax=Nocardiopsis sp. N85 TaxID=3029400 RepID=UPI00237F2FBF|nr:hypothetical protein [Nocardiopsis sp. N85]MDE3722132.1 hypothetical protein [Nocardiopsis sp. N85]